ncbi:VOC family protein [Microvirga flavescens]|uniref:VOC family protein n=1 Tax=Microvirga flavescens TaxID=2249811 RepID=UPI002479CD98|nr:VOC family protein [Microvirga flavescens]
MPRRIDHLVIAVHDLDKAADFYRRLGFQVGARNRHSWGTENRLWCSFPACFWS